MRKALLIALLVAILLLGMVGTAFGHVLTVTTPSGKTPVVGQWTGDPAESPSGHAATCGLEKASGNPSGTTTFVGPTCPN
jgi:hypothetical protein